MTDTSNAAVPQEPQKKSLAQQIAEARAKREAEQGQSKANASNDAVASRLAETKAVNPVRSQKPKAPSTTPKPSRKAAKKAAPKKATRRLPAQKNPPKAPSKAQKGSKGAPQAAKAGGKASRKCSVCGKSLTRPSSMSVGIGDVCQHHLKLLPKGTTLEDHYAAITEFDVPDGWVKFKDLVAKLQEKGISGYRLIQAIGGERMIRKPLSSHWRVKLVKGVRYINKECMKHLDELKKI